MLNFFVTKTEDGYGGFFYVPTVTGYIAIALLIISLLLVASVLWRSKTTKKLQTKQLVFASLAIALATVASYLKIYKFHMGGSVTLFSMLFICLIGFWYGPRIGIMTSVGYGLLQLIVDPYILSLPQLVIDYVFAFGALGLSGIVRNHKYGLYTGYILGILGRFFFAVLSGYIFFASAAPETMNPLIYSILYNGSYIGTEGILTFILISLPPVRQALTYVKQLANE